MFSSGLKRLSRVLFALTVLAAGGCGPFWVNPYITVEPSNLNWMEIHYYNTTRQPTRRISLYMNGAGHVEVRKGTSALISNDFAKGYQEDAWHDIRTQRMDVDPKHINEVFQNLVNNGVLDREKWGRKTDRKGEFHRFIAVKSNLNNVTYSERENIFESDPDLAELLLDTVREFDNPVLR